MKTKLLFWLLLVPATSIAGIEWERTVQEFRATPAQEKVSASFRFKNTGSTPVMVRSIRSSCGCTTANLEKREYAPGEAGEIVAEFRFGGRVGRHEKSVTVTTAEPNPATTTLHLSVHIAEPLTLQPSLVFWRLGEARAPKRIDISILPGRPIRLVSVDSTDPRFKTELATIKEGEHYVLTIEPQSTASRATATFTFKTDRTGEPVPLRKAFAAVR